MTLESYYWISRLDGILSTCTVFLFFSVLGAILSGSVFFSLILNDYDRTDKKFKVMRNSFFGCVISLLIFWIGVIFIPSSKDVVSMINSTNENMIKECNCNE